MLAMRNHLPDGTVWAAFGIGPAQFPMVAQAVLLGVHVRVGFELPGPRTLVAVDDSRCAESAGAIDLSARFAFCYGGAPCRSMPALD
jgi:uncharacterized protein (DUF849 family)